MSVIPGPVGDAANRNGSGYGETVTAIVANGDRRDGIDALLDAGYSEDDLYNHQGDVWNQFHWKVIVR